jgi:hypothetical protein
MAEKHAFLLPPVTINISQNGDVNAIRSLENSWAQSATSLEMHADKSKHISIIIRL